MKPTARTLSIGLNVQTFIKTRKDEIPQTSGVNLRSNTKFNLAFLQIVVSLVLLVRFILSTFKYR